VLSLPTPPSLQIKYYNWFLPGCLCPLCGEQARPLIYKTTIPSTTPKRGGTHHGLHRRCVFVADVTSSLSPYLHTHLRSPEQTDKSGEVTKITASFNSPFFSQSFLQIALAIHSTEDLWMEPAASQLVQNAFRIYILLTILSCPYFARNSLTAQIDEHPFQHFNSLGVTIIKPFGPFSLCTLYLFSSAGLY
jgi:hypothetical protein